MIERNNFLEPKNFLFVHGSWHTAAHWNAVVERLVGMGHRAFAMDLPGSGLNATYPQSYLRNDFIAFATEPSPIGGIQTIALEEPCATQYELLSRTAATGAVAFPPSPKRVNGPAPPGPARPAVRVFGRRYSACNFKRSC
jgi:hypothetical protein